MKTPTTWNPFRKMEEAQNRFSTFFGGFPTFPIRFPKNGDRFKLADWSPLVDIIEARSTDLVATAGAMYHDRVLPCC